MLAETYFPGMEIGGNLLILLVVTFIFLFRYLIARIRHREVIAAIEKGISPTQLKAVSASSPRWITNITFGIILLLIGLFFALFSLTLWGKWSPDLFFGRAAAGIWPVLTLFAGTVLSGVGIASLVRGILQRRVEISEINDQEQTSKDEGFQEKLT